MLNLNFKPFPLINTDRLVLRQLNITDTEDLFFVRTHPVVLRYTHMAVHQNPVETKAYIERMLLEEITGEVIMWAITLNNSPKLVGTICYWNIEPENDRAEMGYILNPDLHAQGLMGEAVTAVIKYGFEEMQLQHIVADLNEENIASVQLLKRRGFVKQGQSQKGGAMYVLTQQNKPHHYGSIS